MKKFGQAAHCDPALNLSTRSPDIIAIEDPKTTYKEEEVDPLAQARMAKERQLEKELLEAADEVATARVRPAPGREEPETKQEMPTRTPGKYVPPQRSSEPVTVEESTTIRVSHLPMESTEDDVRALFQPFGDVNRVSMVRLPLVRCRAPIDVVIVGSFNTRVRVRLLAWTTYSQRKLSPSQTAPRSGNREALPTSPSTAAAKLSGPWPDCKGTHSAIKFWSWSGQSHSRETVCHRQADSTPPTPLVTERSWHRIQQKRSLMHPTLRDRLAAHRCFVSF